MGVVKHDNLDDVAIRVYAHLFLNKSGKSKRGFSRFYFVCIVSVILGANKTLE